MKNLTKVTLIVMFDLSTFSINLLKII